MWALDKQVKIDILITLMEIKPISGKIKVGGYSHKIQDAMKERRRREAEDRKFEHDSLSLTEKVAKIKSRRGNSKRELDRLLLQVGPAPAPVVATVKTKSPVATEKVRKVRKAKQ